MRCTVLVPSYRRPEALLQCLKAVLTGKRIPDQVVVVLRDTDEESHQLLARWLHTATHGHLVQVVDVHTRGQIAAMNRGLEAVDHEVVVFTDDDAVPRGNWLERLMSHYADPQVGGVGGRDVVHHGDKTCDMSATRVGEVTWYGKIVGNHHCQVDGPPRDVAHLKGVNMSFRRELLRPFDPQIWGPHFNDTDQSLGVHSAGFRLIYDPRAIVDHYPQSRPDSVAGRDLADPRQAFLDAHDHCHLLMKYRSGWHMMLWLPYLTLVGSRNCPGFLLFLAQLLTRNPGASARFAAVLSGTRARLQNQPRPDTI